MSEIEKYSVVLFYDGAPITCQRCKKFVLSKKIDEPSWSCNSCGQWSEERDDLLQFSKNYCDELERQAAICDISHRDGQIIAEGALEVLQNEIAKALQLLSDAANRVVVEQGALSPYRDLLDEVEKYKREGETSQDYRIAIEERDKASDEVLRLSGLLDALASDEIHASVVVNLSSYIGRLEAYLSSKQLDEVSNGEARPLDLVRMRGEAWKAVHVARIAMGHVARVAMDANSATNPTEGSWPGASAFQAYASAETVYLEALAEANNLEAPGKE